MSINSPWSNDTFSENLSWFPSDDNDRLLIRLKDVTFWIAIFPFILSIGVVISSLKTLTELAYSSNRDSGTKNATNMSLVVRTLKSKYAPVVIICGNGAFLFSMVLLWFIMYFDVGGEAACDPIQRTIISLYSLSLWATYILFEIRRIATGSEKLKGIRYWIMQAVRYATVGVPVFAVVGYFTTAGIYIEDLHQCLIFTDPIIALLFFIGDGTLSIGHIMVFIFAIRQKSNFKVSVAGSLNKKAPPSSTSTLPTLESGFTLLNRGLVSSQNNANSKLQAISRRNLRLALITIASTETTMMVAVLISFGSPPIESISARPYLYLRHVSQIFGFFDGTVNMMSMLIMTSSWQPAYLKKMSAKISSMPRKQVPQESDVSTLGRE